MTEAQGAVGLDRLPWLADEPPAPNRGGSVLPWALAVTALVAASAYWFGATATHREEPTPRSAAAPSQTVPLPQARPAPAAHLEPVEPIVAPPIAIVEQPAREPTTHRTPIERVRDTPVRRVVEHADSQSVASVPEAKPVETKPVETKADDVPQIWPVRVIPGASGRLVRIGAFGSVHQAKKGWWAIMRVNPTLKRLPALVVPVQSRRNGKTYYRLQMGTTSQAHSAVLCQRMRMIAQSCVVIGLNGADGEVAL